MALIATLELGGTKTLVAVGRDPLHLEPVRLETGEPGETLDRVARHLAGEDFDAIGVAAFGPIGLSPGTADYGRLLTTPKTGWSGFDLAGWITGRWGVPVTLDTDVNSSAVGEWSWGAARGCQQPAYVTVGTGIGGGLVVGGRPLHGDPHPEVGHVPVERHPADHLDGVCAHHGDCLEGLASGSALNRRYSLAPERLTGADLGEAVALTSWYLAQGLALLVLTWAPDRIVLGGGVSRLPGLHREVARRLADRVGSYPRSRPLGELGFLVGPELGDLSALAGAHTLASGV